MNVEMYCPSVDVCGWCGDSECDGIACIAALNPDDPNDHDAIERLHSWLRRGQLTELLLRLGGTRPLPPGPHRRRLRSLVDRTQRTNGTRPMSDSNVCAGWAAHHATAAT